MQKAIRLSEQEARDKERRDRERLERENEKALFSNMTPETNQTRYATILEPPEGTQASKLIPFSFIKVPMLSLNK